MNHCKRCGNNIPGNVYDCEMAGYTCQNSAHNTRENQNGGARGRSADNTDNGAVFPREGIEEIVDSIKFITHPDSAGIMGSCGSPCRQCARDEKLKSWLRTTLHQELQKARAEESGKRNAVVKEYKDEGVMFVLKVEDGKTYEASMPIPKWAEVGKLQLRDHSELDQEVSK